MQTWKVPHGQQVVFKGYLVLHILTVCCWHDEFPETLSSALSPCWQWRCIIYFLSPRFYPKASLLVNEIQWLCRQGRDKQPRAGRTFPMHLGRRFWGQILGRQGGGIGRWREKNSQAVSSAGQPPGISTSSSQEWDIVLALVLISLCEELQSCFFSVCTRKAVKSYDRAASWQTLWVKSHKCYGVPVISTSCRTSSVTADWASHTSPAPLGRWQMQHQAGGSSSSALFPANHPLLTPSPGSTHSEHFDKNHLHFQMLSL